jgi:hypothetical protein
MKNACANPGLADNFVNAATPFPRKRGPTFHRSVPQPWEGGATFHRADPFSGASPAIFSRDDPRAAASGHVLSARRKTLVNGPARMQRLRQNPPMARPAAPAPKDQQRRVSIPGVLAETVRQRFLEFRYPGLKMSAIELIDIKRFEK